MDDLAVVVMTRDRVDELLATLQRLEDVPGRVVVADNGSADGTVERVRRSFPAVEVLALDANRGVAARNLAVARTSARVVAFNDDDSWWDQDSLRRLPDLFAAHPALGAVTARILVEPAGTVDPTSAAMASSPIDDLWPALPGCPVLGFLACATAVRREAFLDVGGFEERFHFAGEEQPLAADLANAGWALRYVDDLTVHHAPSSQRPASAWRRRRELRNRLWFHWTRRPLATALTESGRSLGDASPVDAMLALASALRGLPWVVRGRSPVREEVERQLRRLDRAGRGGHARETVTPSGHDGRGPPPHVPD